MPILNINNYFSIESYNNFKTQAPNPTIKHGSHLLQKLESNLDGGDYWFIEFLNGDAFYHYPVDELVPKYILNKIISGEITLCISNTHEAYHYVIEDIYKFVILRCKIPPQNILYITNSVDIIKEIDHVSQKYGIESMRTLFFSIFEASANHDLKSTPYFFARNTLDKNIYDKKFISFNGLWRYHRMLFVSFLQALNITDEGYVSYCACPESFVDNEQMFPSMIEVSKNNPNILELLETNKESVINLKRLFIDTSEQSTGPWIAASNSSADKSFYENTYFSVVTETLCLPNHSADGYYLGRAISEKTLKPILNKHPFLIMGVPRILKVLKYLGYKTFSPFIDESYDDEIDGPTRVYMIAKETERLCNLKGSELSEFLEGCKPIVEHNLHTLANKQNFNYSIISL